MELELKILRMQKLGIPQERIVKRLSIPQATISRYLSKKEIFPKWINSDLKQGFTVPQVAEKHVWPESLVWSLKLEGKNDLVLDPMAGGGVTADTCLALNRRCWSFDMEDRADTRNQPAFPSA